MQSRFTVAAIAACLLLQACSSRPREFTPTLAPSGIQAAAGSQSEFEAAYAQCQEHFVAGKLDSSGRLGSAAAGVGAGATTAVVGTSAAVATASYAGMAVVAATVVLLPFAVLGGAWGMSKMKRAKKERAIKTAMEGCLEERGYRVAGWSKGVKKPAVVGARSAAN